MKITVAGLGYVGLSMATLLSTKHEVIGYDINSNIVEMINNRKSHLKDKEIIRFLSEENLNLLATVEKSVAFNSSDYLVIATPTDYNDESNQFDTTSIEECLDEALKFSPNIHVVIKSTIPVGYIDALRIKYNKDNIFFSPEFLREGKALYDNLYPSRIIIGSNELYAIKFGETLRECSLKKDANILYMESREAEAVKLFSNTYLALRISFFNEIDTYAELNNLNTSDIIQGMSLDPRIGDYYNNPSFGYGGYCLPKDTKQAVSNFDGISNATIIATVHANELRKKHIFSMIQERQPKVVGIYRLTMKEGSDNFRSSAIFSIMNQLDDVGIKVVIYEPLIGESKFGSFDIISDFNVFCEKSDVIVANRVSVELQPYINKIYTRDIFNNN